MRIVRRVCQPVFILILLFSLIGSAASSVKAGTLSWTRVNIPAEGQNAGWVLAPGSDIRCLTIASDGTLYCAANPASTPYRLFKSGNQGTTWSYTGRVTDDIIAIAIPASNPQQVFYATSSRIYQSDDAGNNFRLIGDSPGGAGAGGVEITSLAVTIADGKDWIMIGTRDSDNQEFGGVYLLEEDENPLWHDLTAGNYDIAYVAFSPAFTQDRQLIAIGTDEYNTFITTNINNTGWNTEIGASRLDGIICVAASIAFPADYQSGALDRYTQFVGINTGVGKGDVYRLEGRMAPDFSRLTDLHAGSPAGDDTMDVASLAVSGNASAADLFAGAAGKAGVYTSADSGLHWQTGGASPSGESQTSLALARDYLFSGMLYLATSGNESAFSCSRDRGQNWVQTALIDTLITSLRDLAVSPDLGHDNEVFMITADQRTSVWRSLDAGQIWERIFCGTVDGAVVAQVLLSPQYAGNHRVLLSGTSANVPSIWESRDGGRSFIRLPSVNPQDGAAVIIDAWAITPDDVLLVAGFDGHRTSVYRTAPGGLYYVDRADCGNLPVYSIATSPDFADDHTILAGNTDGGVFFSMDGGLIFEQSQPGVGQPLAGEVSVTFDHNFSQNKIIYAAGDRPNTGVYRIRMDAGTGWERVDYTLPAGARLGQLTISPNGVLYAANSQSADPENRKGGIERCLEPAASAPFFETATAGLATDSVIKKLSLSGDQIWAIDAAQPALYVFQDSLTLPVTLAWPVNGASGLANHNLDLSWESAAGAILYHWQLDLDAAFPGNPEEMEGETGSSGTRISTLDENTTYYWRVRVSQPFSGPWSQIRSFNTSRIGIPHLSEPKSGASAVSPAFKWSVAENADQYELLVSRNDSFTDLVINKQGAMACNANVWQCDIVLPYSTTYYWRVRGLLKGIPGEWSEVGVFTTMSAPAPTTHGSAATPSPSVTTLTAPKLTEPKSGDPVPLRPIFKWSVSNGAERYELVVSESDDFTELVIDKTGANACNANAWASTDDLKYGTSFYWKVRAVGENDVSQWSAVNVFTTISRPSPSTSAMPSSPAQTSPTAAFPSPTGVEKTGGSPSASITPVDQPAPISALAQSTTPPLSTTTPPPPSIVPPQRDPIESSNRLIFFLIGGLVVLTGVLIGVVIYMLRKFRRF